MSEAYIILCIRYIDPVINDEIEIRELFSLDSRSFNNSLIILLHISHVFYHAGDTQVSSDWSTDQSLAREYRYRHVLFYVVKERREEVNKEINPFYCSFNQCLLLIG